MCTHCYLLQEARALFASKVVERREEECMVIIFCGASIHILYMRSYTNHWLLTHIRIAEHSFTSGVLFTAQQHSRLPPSEHIFTRVQGRQHSEFLLSYSIHSARALSNPCLTASNGTGNAMGNNS